MKLDSISLQIGSAIIELCAAQTVSHQTDLTVTSVYVFRGLWRKVEGGLEVDVVHRQPKFKCCYLDRLRNWVDSGLSQIRGSS